MGDIVTNLEKTSLEAHVDLCALRYTQLDKRLSAVENKLDGLQKEVIDGQKSLKSVIITSTSTIVASLLSLILAFVFDLHL